jgi:acyl carrier protein
MNNEQILEKFENILLMHGFEGIFPNRKIVDDLGADSLDVVEIIMSCESQFNISVPDEEIEKIFTVEDAVNLIAKYANPQ